MRNGQAHAQTYAPAAAVTNASPFTLQRELHKKRNHRPIADTIRELLETTRAHAGFAFRKGGERVLANVYRLTDLARSFEVGGGATGFRAFVEYLESEHEASDTSEAPVLEQEGAGVQLMTVHKAKELVDYKTDRRERRRVGQVQLYALALERATALPARGIVLEA